jgi:RNA polymerase sigma-70 factor, ECF subfamily
LTGEWDTLERARRGDEAAWRALLCAHHPRLLALALLITGSAAAAQDIAQESLVRLLRADLPHRAGSVRGWLATTAYRLALKERQRTNRQTDLAGVEAESHSDSPLGQMIRDEQMRLIAEAIRRLSPEHRDCLVLRFYGDHSYEDIAALTIVPVGTVKSRLFYAVKACRAELFSKGVFTDASF